VINRLAITRIEIPPAHTFTTLATGWRIDFSAAGQLRIVGQTGGNDSFDVGSGDFLVAIGEDYYVSRLVAAGGA
jgi:hypothetical protein